MGLNFVAFDCCYSAFPMTTSCGYIFTSSCSGTANGWKVGIMLEELGIEYDAHGIYDFCWRVIDLIDLF